MAPKKKPGAADGEVDLYEEFKKKLKKNEQEFDLKRVETVSEIIKKMDEGVDVRSWAFDAKTPFEAMSLRVVFQSLQQVKFLDIDALRFWKCNGGDESVRSVCYYLDMDPPPNVKDLQFCDNGVTSLGCECLARTLGPNGNKMINALTLDYNKFGTEGVEKLSLGLSQNATLRHLSLQYCNIGEDGGQYIAHILMFYRNALEVLRLRGNYLGNNGVVDVLSGARRTKALASIDLYDNKFSDSEEVVDAIKYLIVNTTTLKYYDLSGNQISDKGASELVRVMIGQSHLEKVLVNEQVSKATWEALEEVTSGGKGKGKKGKKKK